MKVFQLLIVTFACSLAPQVSFAALITFVAEGRIGNINSNAGLGELGLFSATYTFDSSTADSDPRSDYGLYEGAITDATLVIESTTGPLVFELDPTRYNKINVFGNFVDLGIVNQFHDVYWSLLPAHGLTDVKFYFTQRWIDGHYSGPPPFDSDAIPTIPPGSSPDDDSDAGLGSSEYSTSAGFINGVYAPPVPTPPALWLFGSGLLGLVGMARRMS